jgi:hypothetical protein
MKLLIPVFLAILAVLVIACGDSGDSQVVQASEDAGSDVDYCTCVNEPINTNARHKACSALINSMTPEETAAKAIACRESLPVPEGGPDLCYCLRTTTSDVEILKQCEAMIPEDWEPEDFTRKIVECGR